MSDCQQKNNHTTAAEKLIKDGVLMTTAAFTTTGIFYTLRMVGIGQHNALLTSASLAWLMSLPAWK